MQDASAGECSTDLLGLTGEGPTPVRAGSLSGSQRRFCTRSRKWGSFVIGRKTIKKRMRAKLLAIKTELRRIMHDPIAKAGAWIKRMLQDHLNYFAVSGNHPSLWWFFNQVKRLWLLSLGRRSQTARLSWEKFVWFVDRFFPPIKTLHALPCHRFDAKTRGKSPVR
jgi:RNA-directed DNA polymerase